VLYSVVVCINGAVLVGVLGLKYRDFIVFLKKYFSFSVIFFELLRIIRKSKKNKMSVSYFLLPSITNKHSQKLQYHIDGMGKVFGVFDKDIVNSIHFVVTNKKSRV